MMINSIPRTILEAFYQNGRFGTNRASVVEWADGSFGFCNGFSDPFGGQSIVDAERYFHNFIADKVPADRYALLEYA